MLAPRISSYPKSVIDDKRLCGSELSPKACEAVLHGTGDGMASRNQSRGDECSSELQGFDADPSPAPEFPTRVWASKPFLRRKANNDDDVLARPRRRHHIWWALGKPQQGRNLKDLKGLKCHYTFGTRALASLALASGVHAGNVVSDCNTIGPTTVVTNGGEAPGASSVWFAYSLMQAGEKTQ